MNCHPATHRHTAACPFRGLTLVEMLVAMTLTLLLMGAVAQLFGMLGKGVNDSRTSAELGDRMRATAYRLRQDMAGLTVDITALPPMRSSLNTGYLEIIEGPESDAVTYLMTTGAAFNKWNGTYDESKKKWVGSPEPYLSDVGSDDRLVGDVDDVLLFTTRTTGELFSGRADTRNANLEGGGLRSPFAEVAWFCRRNDLTSNPRTYTLYRRQRLIMAHPGAEPFVNTTAGGAAVNSFGGPPNTLPFTNWTALYALTDVSCRLQNGLAVPNTLGDLTRRENRFMHAQTFPYEFPLPLYATPMEVANLTLDSNPTRFGEDVILTNVLAFDVRVFDPAAVIRAVPARVAATNVAVTGKAMLAVQPGDPGYNAPGAVVGTTGAYVDLAWGASIGDAPGPLAIGEPFPASEKTAFQGYGVKVGNRSGRTLSYPTYDTWSDYYEINGVNDDGGTIDEGTNGLDDTPTNDLIDEATEQETSPPYPVALKTLNAGGAVVGGIQIRIRCYEPSSRQVRQITVNTF
jgi:hypothetical protein